MPGGPTPGSLCACHYSIPYITGPKAINFWITPSSSIRLRSPASSETPFSFSRGDALKAVGSATTPLPNLESAPFNYPESCPRLSRATDVLQSPPPPIPRARSYLAVHPCHLVASFPRTLRPLPPQLRVGLAAVPLNHHLAQQGLLLDVPLGRLLVRLVKPGVRKQGVTHSREGEGGGSPIPSFSCLTLPVRVVAFGLLFNDCDEPLEEYFLSRDWST